MLDIAQDAVKDFSLEFGLPVSRLPKILNRERVLLRSKWMTEELDEFLSANTIEDQADAIVDLIYYALGVFVEMGVPGGKIFEIVHAYNMKKITADGVKVYNSDGKVQKPNEWVPPEYDIRKLLESLG